MLRRIHPIIGGGRVSTLPLFKTLRWGSAPASADEIAPEISEIQGTFIASEIDPIANSHLAMRTPFQRNHFVRLDKLLSNLGIVTRRNAVSFIKRNNIRVAIGEDEYQEFDHTSNSLVTRRKEVLKRVPYQTIVYPPAVRLDDEPLEYVQK